MQGTFFGLTTVFHLLVIVAHFIVKGVLRIFGIDIDLEREVRFQSVYLNLLIVGTVFSVVGFAAWDTIENSVESEYSTVGYLSNRASVVSPLVPDEATTTEPEVSEVVVADPVPTEVVLPDTDSCKQSAAATTSTTSDLFLVDYLDATGRDSSFGAREALGKQFGLMSYNGTTGENSFIKAKLLEADAALATGTVSCQKD